MFNWDKDAIAFYRKHDHIFKTAMIMYAPVIHVTKTAMEDKQAYKLELPIKIWNSSFALFNVLGTYHTLPWAFKGKFDLDFANTNVGKWVFYLNVSKVIEMWDILFQLLKKREIPFLHVYHHLITLIFCYLCTYNKSICGYWNATINYFVHSLMYIYLLLPRSNFKFLMGKIVARAHVVEMIIGLGINIFSLFVKRQNKVISSIGIAMYLSYLYLFALLLPKRKGEENKDEKREGSVILDYWGYITNAKFWQYFNLQKLGKRELSEFNLDKKNIQQII
jgi:elongation of very long chain fatty acids protein 6